MCTAQPTLEYYHTICLAWTQQKYQQIRVMGSWVDISNHNILCIYFYEYKCSTVCPWAKKKRTCFVHTQVCVCVCSEHNSANCRYSSADAGDKLWTTKPSHITTHFQCSMPVCFQQLIKYKIPWKRIKELNCIFNNIKTLRGCTNEFKFIKTQTHSTISNLCNSRMSEWSQFNSHTVPSWFAK
jgi:hypothetical protein